jgi:hypothetical protein
MLLWMPCQRWGRRYTSVMSDTVETTATLLQNVLAFYGV